MTKYAIVGFGCAGYYGAKTIRENDPQGEITVFSEHEYAPYNPMLTTYYVAGKIPFAGLFPFGDLEKIQKDLNLKVVSGTKVESVDAKAKKVVCADGTSYEYDKLLVATGANAFAPAIEGLKKEEAFYMRTVEDAILLKEALEKNNYKKALVVGASMVGIKVVEILNNKGIDTVFADMATRIFPIAAYESVSAEIERRIAAKGVEFAFGKALNKVEKNGSDFICTMTDGSQLTCDLIVLCIGTRTNLSLMSGDDVKINRGIVVNNEMESSDPSIFSAGDCCEGTELQSKNNMIIGLWANAAHQGTTAGANMAGVKADFSGNFLHNITHFMDMDFIGFGDNRIKGEVIKSGNIQSGLYVEAVVTENGLAGVNILDNYRISGTVKNYLYRVFEEGHAEISSLQRGILVKEGLRPSFIEKLEGIANGK